MMGEWRRAACWPSAKAPERALFRRSAWTQAGHKLKAMQKNRGAWYRAFCTGASRKNYTMWIGTGGITT